MNHAHYRPDVFEIVVGKEALKAIEIKGLELPFGQSEEKYCYFDDVLIGQYLGEAKFSAKYYAGMRVNVAARHVIKLAPCIEDNRYISTPELEIFFNLLEKLLDKNGVDMICEADCDQNPVEETCDSKLVLSKLYRYLMGKETECPSFIVRANGQLRSRRARERFFMRLFRRRKNESSNLSEMSK